MPFLSEFFASRLVRQTAPALSLYFLFLVWAACSFVFIPDGTQDPLFRLTQVPRTSQFLFATFLLLLYLGVCGFALLRPRPWIELRGARTGIALFFSLLFLNIVSATLPTMVAQIHPGFLPNLSAYIALVLALQAAAIFTALSVLRTPWVIFLMFAGLILVDFYAMYVVLLESFHRVHVAGQVSIFAIVFLALLFLLGLAGKDIFPVRTVNAVLAVTLFAPAILLLFDQDSAANQNRQLAAFGGIKFRSFPNVHIVSFDALTAPSLASKYLKLDDLPYERVLSQKGAIRFANAFASHVPTKPFANSIMRLAHPGFAEVYSYFAGRTDSPLAHVFRTNGYGVSTGYSSMYFGMKGPFVSDYRPSEALAVGNNTLCALAVDSPIKFFGFCKVASLLGEKQKQPSWPEIVTALIGRSNADPNPWFTFHHIGIPGHTSVDYRTSDAAAFARYRATYQEASAQIAVIVTRLISAMRQDEAKSILFIFGDHGPYLSRTITTEQDPQFFVQDRYGIIAAVPHNESGCGPQALRHYITDYATPERLLAGLIHCLSNDPKVVDAAVKFAEEKDFGRYLYE
ncbi:MAG: hypothetical protein OEM91_07920 [Hyphomicrobiales bacterium]|nr:hypothetical protein [Hyphomicrobiales bacterium]